MHLSERKRSMNRNLAIMISAVIVSIFILVVWRVMDTNPRTFYILLGIAALSFVSIYQIFTRKWRERDEMQAKPFPAEWRKILEDNVVFYRGLSAEQR